MSKVAIDQEARNKAVDPRYSYIVQAPAGSGKTELLTDRILALLAIVNRPEDILAITFTRKAAAEMRERVVLKLEQALHDEPVEEHKKASWAKARAVLQRDAELAWHLLDNPNRLRIQTIDSFCQSLVRLTPSLSGAGATLSPTESEGELLRQAAQKTLDLLDKEPCVKTVLAHLDVNIALLQELLVQMLVKRQSWLSLAQNPADTLREMTKTLADIVMDALEEANDVLGPAWIQHVSAMFVEAAGVLESNGGDNPLDAWLNWHGEPLTISLEDLPLWKGVAEFLLTKDKEAKLRSRFTISNGVDAKSRHKKGFIEWVDSFGGSQKVAESLAVIRDLPNELVTDDHIQLFKDFFECLRLCDACLQEVFRERAEVDFTEIMQRALKALGSQDEPTEMLLKIDADLKHILIDEFQDTNLSQKELLELITSGWMQGDGRTLFLVGDPMQSIYRFRNAEVSLFLNIADAAAKNAGLPEYEKQSVLGNVVMDLLKLQENFRSDAGVVEWVNEIFAQVFPKENMPSLGAIRYSPSHAFKDKKDDPAVRYYPFVYESPEQKDEVLTQALACGVSLVREALAAHPNSDNAVAVLVRSRSHLEGLAEALAAEGIPVQAVKMVPLRETEEVADLVQLIRALSHRNDRLAWMSLLRAPFCGLTLSSLTRLFEDKTQQSIPLQINQYLSDKDSLTALIGEAEAQRLQFIQNAVNIPYTQGDMTFSSYIEQVWVRLGGNDLYATDAAQANIQSVLQVVDSIAPYGCLNLNEFEQKIGNLYAAPTSEKGAVQIMTMHSSKGLEFDEVILFGLHKRPQSDQSGLLEIESEQGNLLIGSVANIASGAKDPVAEMIKKRNKVRQSNEADRLFYVACTRAKEKLHLVYMKHEAKAAHATSMLASVEELIDEELIVPQPALNNQTDNTTGASVWQVEHKQFKRYTLDTLAALSQKHRVEPISFSLHKGGVWVFEDKLHSAIGTTVHYWLEQMGRDKLEGWSVERIQQAAVFIKRQLRHLGVHGEELESASQRVIALLSDVLRDEKGRWLLSYPNATQEWSLYNEDEQNRIVDLALNTGDGWLIVDYKTNQRLEGESSEQFRLRLTEKYREQLMQYATYLHNIDGRPTKAAIYALDGCEWIELF